MKNLCKILVIFIYFPILISQASHAGNGVVSGNGAPIWDQERTVLPHASRIYDFLDAWGRYEPTLVRMIKEFSSSSAKGILFWKTNSSCFLENMPTQEIRANYNPDVNFILLCKAYFELPVERQISTILHELMHYVLKKIPNEISSGEEQWVQAVESYMVKMLLAGPNEFAQAANELRYLIDRNLPNLLLYASVQEIVKDPTAFPIFDDGLASFVMPKAFFNENFVLPHYLPEMLARIWKNIPSYAASSVLERSLPSQYLRANFYPSIKHSPNGTFFVTWQYTEAEYERVLSLKSTTLPFQKFWEKYHQLTERNWLSDEKYFYFFE